MAFLGLTKVGYPESCLSLQILKNFEALSKFVLVCLMPLPIILPNDLTIL